MKFENFRKIIFLFAVFASSSAVDYCAICTNHIACNNAGSWSSGCSTDAALMTLSADIKASILHSHNTYRQKVASGGAAGFTSATKMSRIVWNDELAYVAEFNVKQCNAIYDKCRSTEEFPTAGQSIGLSYMVNAYADLNRTLIEFVDSWYNQISTATQADIDTCPSDNRYGPIANFLMMMQEKTMAIGCAVSRYTVAPENYKATLMTCNYAFTNFGGQTVYFKGTAASKCTQVDATYPSLCAIPPPEITTPAAYDPTTIPTTNYCTYCADHVACNAGNWYPICPTNAEIVPISNSVKESILQAHNYYRNKVASGNQPGFNSAVKMNKLVWDDELAYVASFNVRQCEMKHDTCRKTLMFKDPGQNLAITSTTLAHDKLNTTLMGQIDAWYNEYLLSNQSDIDYCCGGDARFHDIGHFLAMMQDRSTHVGCSVARYTQSNSFKTTLFACNYAFTNWFTEKVYVSGSAGSQCSTRDPVFSNLCYVEGPSTTTSTTVPQTTTTTTIVEPPTTTTTLTIPPSTTTTTFVLPPTTSTSTVPPTVPPTSPSSTNPCSLCANHIACNHPGTMGVDCPPDAHVVPLTETHKMSILHIHNTYRDKIAAGGEPNLSSAAKMMLFTWSDELAYYAQLNVMQCKAAFDACRSTVDFTSPGQNIYNNLLWEFPEVNDSFAYAFSQWYGEVSLTAQEDIDNCCGGTKYNSIGHFLVMIQDRSTAIGCAIARYTRPDNVKASLMTCNYAINNHLDKPVYVKGATASQCPARDKTYPNLCATPPPVVTTPAVYDTTTKPTTDYCALCTNHVACVNNGNWYPICPADASIVPLSNGIKETIVKAHNDYRSKVARGEAVGFNSAAKMNKLYWSDELAYVAEFNVKQCEMKIDECRSTLQFRLAGQNVFIISSSPTFLDLNETIMTGINTWINRGVNVTQNEINLCCGQGRTLFPYLAIVQDRSTAVGCALSRLTNATTNYKTTIMTCNYAYNNIINQKVYVSGPTASLCPTIDATYPDLCAVNYNDPTINLTDPPIVDILTSTTEGITPSTTTTVVTTSTTSTALQTTTIAPMLPNFCSFCTQMFPCSNMQFWNSCSIAATKVELSKHTQTTIVQKINNYRNIVAQGCESNFGSASKMNALVWNKDLQKYAETVATQCNTTTNICVNLQSIKDTSMVSFSTSSLCIYDDPSITASKAIDYWYNRKVYAKPGDLQNITDASTDAHPFLAMVQQLQIYVGCSVTRFTNNLGQPTDFVVCAFSHSLAKLPVFNIGPPASECWRIDRDFPNLCASNHYCGYCENHVACNIEWFKFEDTCPPNAYQEPISDDAKDYIVRKINTVRNMVANGFQQGLSSASKMPAVVRNRQLDIIAEVVAMRCKLESNFCVNGMNFSNAQMNAVIAHPNPNCNYDIQFTAELTIDHWFSKISNVSQTEIGSCCGASYLGKHALMLINDQLRAVGMAAVRFKKTTSYEVDFLVMIFGNGLTNGSPVYAAGPAASACAAKDPVFNALCAP